MLEAKFLSFYRDGHPILHGMNFDVPAGTCLFVKGANGVGKTTLLRILAGFLPIQEGDIKINGIQILNNYDFIAKNVEYVGHLNATKKQTTAWDNVKFWNSLSERASQVDFETKFNDRMIIESFKNQPISFCSAGQIRRVGLSRLTTTKKKIWLIDEPTMALDNSSIRNFKKMVENHCLNGGIAIITTHSELKVSRINSQSLEIKKPVIKENTFYFDPFLTGDW